MDLTEQAAAMARIRALHAEGRYDDALTVADDLLEQCPGVELLIHRGRLIQLETRERHPLEGARDSYLAALELHPESAEALKELGFFEDAIQDDPATALPYFEKASSYAGELLIECLHGRANCLEQVGRLEEARAFRQAEATIAGLLGLTPMSEDLEEDCQ